MDNETGIDSFLDINKVYTIVVNSSQNFYITYNGIEVTFNGETGSRRFYVVSTITVANGYVKFQVQRPFAGITKVWYDSTDSSYGSPIADATVNEISGPHIQDNRAIDWYATYDYMAQIDVEEQGTNQVCIRAEGWYQTYAKSITPFCRFIDRIYLNLNQSLIKVQQGSIVAENCNYQTKIGDMSFILPLNTGGICSFGADNGTIINDDSFTISNVNTSTDVLTTSVNHGWSTGQAVVYVTTGNLPSPLTENTVYYIRVIANNQIKTHLTLADAQSGSNIINITTTGSGGIYVQDAAADAFFHQQLANSCRYLGSTSGTGGQSDGWFNIKGSEVQTTLLAKDFWQKFPKEAEIEELIWGSFTINGQCTVFVLMPQIKNLRQPKLLILHVFIKVNI